ncbi:MAG: 2-C-methyl-D-erythritol 2,4-cyclodiphosphate synthase [Ignavibacteriae bacterium]|nr:2-C-methyl-D-erythritol 2,4-cyclodiphosphate synthase [Ignavibacteriota bacterium]
MQTRVGIGFDVHRLAAGRKLVLGGVEIPHEKGLDGHSDADVLLHAIMDALVGAAALGDIGKHFPNTDPRYKDISSLTLLKHVGNLLAGEKYSIVNIDATVVLEKPKILPFVEQMRRNIASTLFIDVEQVSVKATTNEGLGFIGHGEGAVAHAVTSIVKR